MAAARPVIAIAYGGPAEVVDDHVGRAILPDGPEAVIEALVQTVREVFADPGTWRRRGEEGRHRAEQRQCLGYQNRTSIVPLSSHSRQR